MVWIPYDVVHRRPATRQPVESHRRVVQGRGRWQAGAAHHGRIQYRLRLPLPEAKCREESCPVHDAGGTHVAPFGLLPVQGPHPRARAARGLPGPWRQDGSGAVGRDRAVASALLFEAMVVELAKTQPVADVAAQVSEREHEAVAVHPPLRPTRPGSTRTTRVWRPSASTRPAAKATGTSPWSPT